MVCFAYNNKLQIILMIACIAACEVNAEESVVIDSNMLNEQFVSEPGSSVPAPGTISPEASRSSGSIGTPESEVILERLHRGGKMSVRQKAALAKAEAAMSNKQEAEEFLAANRSIRGVISLPNGLQYLIRKPGRGKKPIDSDIILCRYTGKLIDGTDFDYTAGNAPVPLAVSDFIPGMREAVKLMAVGSKWQVVVPPHLAYGEKGDRGIGPNAVLIYEIELNSIK